MVETFQIGRGRGRSVEFEDRGGHPFCVTVRGRVDYLLVGSTGVSELVSVAELRPGRRTVLTFPLFPPPQKN
jgi:hypothetical protein